MTNEEAIRLIRNLLTMCEFTDAYDEPIDSDAYYEAVDMAISVLEKQIPKKPVMTQTNFYQTLWWLDCPSCGNYVGMWNSKLGRGDMYNNSNRKICPYCGQVIDWEKDE